MRWIFPGQLETAVARWFARFPATTELREDTYLLDPHLPGLSVKVRAGAALEVKAYRGSPGILQVPGRARGRLQAGTSGPFPAARPAPAAATRPAGSQSAKGGASAGSRWPAEAAARGPGPGRQPRYAVELTEIRTRGQDWWTLGFEATGPADLLRSELQATAALVFAHALPGSVEPGPGQSRSYAEWLSPRPGAESHP